MNVPIEIIAAIVPILLTALIGSLHSRRNEISKLAKRIERIERTVLTLVIMLRDRGFKVPSPSDTERFLKSDFL